MSTGSIRGWAGAVIGLLGLFLWRGGPSLAEAAPAARGCKDDAGCRAVRQVTGFVTEAGLTETSNTASCQGDCGGTGALCAEMWSDNPDGTRTFQCSCDPTTSPAACSGFATVKKAGENWVCSDFRCMGDCSETPPPPVPKECKPEVYDTTRSGDCPPKTTAKFKCVCRE